MLPFGRFTPHVVLYTDGEFFIPGDYSWYLETTLSTAQMCTLLERIANTGFFQIPGTGALGRDDPIYSFAATPEVSYGAPAQYIQVNGNPAQIVGIYSPYKDYVISPIKSVLRLLNNYRPAGLKLYKPDRLLLVVDEGRSLFDELTSYHDNRPTATPQLRVWPAQLPPLADLWGRLTYHQVFIQGDLVEPMLNLNLPQHFGVFTDQGQEYTVIMRPLLPDETLSDLDFGYPSNAERFDLPFQCPPLSS